MRYPFWFPYPSCWLKALVLTVSLIPLTIFLRLFGKSTLYALAIFTNVPDWRWGIALALVGCIIPIFILGHIYQLLWGEPSKKLPLWIPAPKSWAEGLWMWFVIGAAIAILFLGFLMWYDFNPPKRMPDELGNVLTGGFLAIAAYLYHVRELTQRLLFPQKKKFEGKENA